MEFFTPVFNFVIDKSNNRARKLMLIVISLFVLFLIDNIFGFSYYYNLNNKVNISNQIHSIVSDNKTDPTVRQRLNRLNNDVLNHKSARDFLYDSIANYDKSNDPLHFILFYFSSSISVIFLMIGFSVVVYKELNKPNFMHVIRPPWFTIKVLLVCFIGLLLISVVLTWACSLIPIIAGQILYNYFINIGINGFLVWGLVLLTKKKTEDKTEKPNAGPVTTKGESIPVSSV